MIYVMGNRKPTCTIIYTLLIINFIQYCDGNGRQRLDDQSKNQIVHDSLHVHSGGQLRHSGVGINIGGGSSDYSGILGGHTGGSSEHIGSSGYNRETSAHRGSGYSGGSSVHSGHSSGHGRGSSEHSGYSSGHSRGSSSAHGGYGEGNSGHSRGSSDHGGYSSSGHSSGSSAHGGYGEGNSGHIRGSSEHVGYSSSGHSSGSSAHGGYREGNSGYSGGSSKHSEGKFGYSEIGAEHRGSFGHGEGGSSWHSEGSSGHSGVRTEHTVVRTAHSDIRTEHSGIHGGHSLVRTDHSRVHTGQNGRRTGYSGTRVDHSEVQTSHREGHTEQSEVRIEQSEGLYPELINLASTAIITANATCGEIQQEIYCKPTLHSRGRDPQCSMCDGRSADMSRRHPVQSAIDGSATWWQSPSLDNGWENQWITLTLDLKQIYQVDYVIVKSGISPRPGNWILERSIDGVDFQPWQFYATSDSECMTLYDMPASSGPHRFNADDEVICTSQFSQIRPLEGGEIHTSLVNGRPGASGPSSDLLRFTAARYIRMRFQKILTLPEDRQATGLPDRSEARRYFYSIKDISIGGRCSCNGHASKCSLVDGEQKCECEHNTCGNQCNQCCPMFNQFEWGSGSTTNGVCQPCNCHGHATTCRYEPHIERAKLSQDSSGKYNGGGLCVRCQHHTVGSNCEQCRKGYYRPQGVKPDAKKPCVPCTCEGPGVTPECVADDTQASLGLTAGSCVCKTGFSGQTCTTCAEGYRNFPRCEACPCSRAGSTNKVCEGHCECKNNILGRGCDTCKRGTFHLDEYNPVGCTECFCNGVTDKCEAAKLPIYIISDKEDWKVADLGRTQVIDATKSGSSVSMDHEQMTAFSAYYWVAPASYLGERMTSYGQKLRIKTSWVTLRGDTSGKATKCPEIIIEGAGYRIAYGGKYHRNVNELLMDVPLYEHDWYHFPKDIADIPNNEEVSSYAKGKVSRREMMDILRSMEGLMIRARYNTVQAESKLHDVLLESGKEGADSSTATMVTGPVERCHCPEGYTGLSCGQCLPGYRRINQVIFGGRCVPCDCNGHVDYCHAKSGKCGECKHNTVGRNCERCAEGFYGDATRGTAEDCKPCACPLTIGQNHFTPECQETDVVHGADAFKCACPTGYEGNRCQDCIDGYFGNPMVPGNYCQPCDCNGNVDPHQKGYCDKRTGQCINCLENTAGWNCEKCEENHYGDPKRGQCLQCDCHTTGSTSMTCNERTGQCPCKELYGGRRCETCVSGRGGIADGCPLCECSKRGSKSTLCDPITGQCPCKKGVEGRRCNLCLPNHFGDLDNGCQRCNCDSRGSIAAQCDIVTGQCQCKSQVIGRTCNSCRVGYWGLSAGKACQKCKCSVVGTLHGQCNDMTGQCECKPGVGGPECTRCMPGYWGYSHLGCNQCDPCDHPGKNCDPNSGRCICPANTEGDRCERCLQGFWDYSADIGCRPCSCSGPGSLERQCDPRNGRCICRQGHEGSLCNQCSFGFYGYPTCRPCSCSRLGSDLSRCKDDQCQCDENGQCPCKENVRGLNCNQCAEGTFGLAKEYQLGCFSCFCFKKSSHCSQAELTWSQLALPGQRELQITDGNTKVNITNQLYVIPDVYGDVTIGTSFSFLAPLYWQLPLELLRDKTMSYNGYLRFRIQSEDREQPSFPEQILQSYPLVSIQGNWQLILEHYPQRISPDGRYEVRLHEKSWKKQNSNERVTREQMMIALQNLQHVLIRATSSDDFTVATLSEVTLDIAAEGTPVSSRRAVGVERCHCPENYSGFSCQNPNIGFYRWFKDNHIQSTIVIDLVGESKPCMCNGRANICDQETGVCVGCRENTAGPHCEYCSSGYYGQPNLNSCKPCACPSKVQIFAETCEADPYSGYICHCKEGYTGNKCERCANGYYGNPIEIGGSCIPCKCDPHGSKGIGCDSDGTCRCKSGITGRDCSQCLYRHVVSENGCISCEDGCVDVLLDDIQNMINEVTLFDVNSIRTAPWHGLQHIMNETQRLRAELDNYESREGASQAMLIDFDLDYTARVLKGRAERVKDGARDNLPEGETVLHEAKTILNLILGLRSILEDGMSRLENYALGVTPSITVAAALDEAELLLRQIKARSFKQFDEKSRFELKRAKQLLDEIKMMLQDNSRLDDLVLRVNSMDNKMDDLTGRIRTSNALKDLAVKINMAVQRKIDRMQINLEEISSQNVYIEDRNFNSTRFIRRARRKLDSTYNNFEILEDLMIDLRNKSSLLADFEATLWQLNSEYRKKYVAPAENHALHLKAQSIKLDRLFNKTRDVADGPLRAAEAYQRIVDAIMSAQEAARNALDTATNAYQAAYPGNPDDSLVRRSKLSVERSKGLRDKGNALRISVIYIAKNLENQWIGLQTTKQIIDDSNEKLRLMQKIIRKLSSSGISADIVRALGQIDRIAEESDRNLRHVESLAMNLTIIRDYTLEIKSQDTDLLKGIDEQITFINGATMKGQRLGGNLRNQANRIEVIGNNLKDRIEALKRKIKQTRQHATSIRVSLTTDRNGICQRQYRPYIQPATTSRLTLGYAINTRHRDAMLLFMGATNHTDYMAVEMINRKIHFTWNAGKGSKTIIHPLTLETNNFQVSDENRWYHITINRIGNIGELQVRPAVTKHSSRHKLYLEPVSDASPAGYTRMDLQPTDAVYVGGVPEEFSDSVRAKNFAGCLHYVTLDGEPLGLWNFTESTGCDACNEGFDLELKVEDKTANSFNGKGYFKGVNVLRRSRPFYSVVLSFRSLDEDALLFLAVNDMMNQYFSLELEDGKIKFTVQFDEQSRLVLTSEKKLNNMNDLIQIQAIVENSARNGKRIGRLVVADQDQMATIRGGPNLDLAREPFYFGGVDPQFDKNRWGRQIQLRSILGCMGALSVLEVGKNPHTDGQFYGISPSCPNQPISNAGFLGEGYLEMPSQVLKKVSSFGFTFKTMAANSILMISTFKGQPLRGALFHPPDYYSVSINEGRLDLRLYAGSVRHRLLSRLRYNDGNLHSFFVTKENRKVQLFVDDEIVNSTRLDRGKQIVKAPGEGGLYFGGVPSNLVVDHMVGSSIPFKGCIQDVIVNNELLSFNEPIRFDNAFIGRCADLPKHAMGGMTSDEKQLMACMPPKQHTVEYGALKFGDQPESHVVLPMKKNVFKHKFHISFEFRTYYPSGLFLLAYNQRIFGIKNKLDMIAVHLLNSRLVIDIYKKSKRKRIISPLTALNSGQWRKVTIEKSHRKLMVYVDEKLIKTEKIAKKNSYGSDVFLGGFPASLSSISMLPTFEPFRGCLRNVNVDGEKYEIPSLSRNDQIVGVGQCFATVQPGSYFPGDAYAVYDEKFKIGSILELRLEFRTWELNGVLLSVSDPMSSVALSLELTNGAVLLSVNMSHKRPFSARVSLYNRYEFCDNRWHTVTAHYIQDSLTLRVDDYPEAYGFNGSQDLKKVLAEAPLHIGGLPANGSQGTLVGSDNFKGCIRNIVLNSEIKDWTDMYRLHHVFLNACPVQ